MGTINQKTKSLAAFPLGTTEDVFPITTSGTTIPVSLSSTLFKATEDKERFTIEIPAVGYTKEEIEVYVIRNILRVNAKKRRRNFFHNSPQILEEIDTDEIVRVFKLADFVQHEHISATYKEDVITLHFSPGKEKDIHAVEIK